MKDLLRKKISRVYLTAVGESSVSTEFAFATLGSVLPLFAGNVLIVAVGEVLFNWEFKPKNSINSGL